MKRLSGLLIVAAFAALTVSAWALVNRPTPEPAWPKRIQGFAFQPYQKDQDAIRRDDPTLAQIKGDLALLAGKTRAVRTYSTLGTIGEVPALARRFGIHVTVGAWLNSDRVRNSQEVERAIQLANRYDNVVRVIVGNEVLMRDDLPLDELTEYLDEVRSATRQPVSTAEPWHVWLAHPELADHVDFLAVHMLPYWEGVDVA